VSEYLLRPFAQWTGTLFTEERSLFKTARRG